ncbi:hypothetical protein [Streptomyces lavendulocolor]|uniref:hypothetical protein n=1 Tax=Streptomyces lavendulocolor TaxID=67316 RepID=UPI0033C478B2
MTPAGGAVRSVTKATRTAIGVASTTPAVGADSARSFALRRAGAESTRSPEAEPPRKVVRAAHGKPTPAWETVVGGVRRDGTPAELHVVTGAWAEESTSVPRDKLTMSSATSGGSARRTSRCPHR